MKYLSNAFHSIKPYLTHERVLCRLFVAWLAYAASLLVKGGSFTDISFTQGASILEMIIRMFLIFACLTCLASILPNYHTDSWMLMITASICVFRWLSDYSAPAGLDLTFDKNPHFVFFLLAVITAYCLTTAYFISRNASALAGVKLSDKVSLLTVAFFGIAGAAIISIVTCLRYKTFAAPNFDFGIFCQMFHYMKTKGLPLVTCERDVLLSHFVVHLSPASYFLLPLYFVVPSPLTLQIGQALILISGLVPLWFLCKTFKLSNKSTVMLCILYSAYPALSTGCWYDFHENCLLTPFLLWMFLFYEKGKKWPMLLLAVCVLMVKEDAAIYILFFSIYIIVSRKDYKTGLFLGMLGLVWFITSMQILNYTSDYWAEYYTSIEQTPSPAISGVMEYRYDNLMYDSSGGLFSAVKTFLNNPGYILTQVFNTESAGIGKLVYLMELLFPIALLPLFSKKASSWLLMAPLLINTITMYSYQYNIGFQYSFGIIAFLFYSATINVSKMKTDTRKYLLAMGMAACLCIYMVSVVPNLHYYHNRWNNHKSLYSSIEEMLNTIPEDASVNASSVIIPHLSDHDIVYEIKYHGDAADVDYVIYRRPESSVESIEAYLSSGYAVHGEIPGEILILKDENQIPK